MFLRLRGVFSLRVSPRSEARGCIFVLTAELKDCVKCQHRYISDGPHPRSRVDPTDILSRQIKRYPVHNRGSLTSNEDGGMSPDDISDQQTYFSCFRTDHVHMFFSSYS